MDLLLFVILASSPAKLRFTPLLSGRAPVVIPKYDRFFYYSIIIFIIYYGIIIFHYGITRLTEQKSTKCQCTTTHQIGMPLVNLATQNASHMIVLDKSKQAHGRVEITILLGQRITIAVHVNWTFEF